MSTMTPGNYLREQIESLSVGGDSRDGGFHFHSIRLVCGSVPVDKVSLKDNYIFINCEGRGFLPDEDASYRDHLDFIREK